jgi:hypothetical protein
MMKSCRPLVSERFMVEVCDLALRFAGRPWCAGPPTKEEVIRFASAVCFRVERELERHRAEAFARASKPGRN